MPSTARAARDRVDACPGVLTLHQAADGLLARVRIPGGALLPQQLAVLARAAADLGDGGLELTSRANLQLRGIADSVASELRERLFAAGLLPSATHERVRNIVASPLSGIDAAIGDIADLVATLDRDLCVRADLAELPGRFLFAVDDGRGDMTGLGADLTITADGDRAVVEAVEMSRGDAVPFVLELAAAFLAVRRTQGVPAWRVAELDGGAAALLDHLRVSRTTAVPASRPTLAPAGVVTQPDGRHALVAIAPLGRLDAAQLALLVDAAGPRGIRCTPWRSLVIPDLVDVHATVRAAQDVGFGVDAFSPWYHVSTCTGRPGCASALADVRADALARLDGWPGQRVRWSGCERRCGRPRDTETDVVATATGYQIIASGK